MHVCIRYPVKPSNIASMLNLKEWTTTKTHIISRESVSRIKLK